MESKRAYFRRLVDRHGMTEDAAIESMAKQFDRRSAQEVAELRRLVGAGAPPAPASQSTTERPQ